MADETICTIPLRKEILKVPQYMRATKAVRAAREYLIRHFKASDILIGQELNNHLHERGQRHPPVKVKVKVYKFKDRFVADMIDAPIMKEEEKKKGMAEKIKETFTGKKPEIPQTQHPPAHETKAEKIEEEKKEVMKHPPQPPKQKKAIREGAPKERKAGERERKKEIFSKTQKPTHEKKK